MLANHSVTIAANILPTRTAASKVNIANAKLVPTLLILRRRERSVGRRHQNRQVRLRVKAVASRGTLLKSSTSSVFKKFMG